MPCPAAGTRSRWCDDSGMTLAELLVTTTLSSVLGMVVVFAVMNNHDVHRVTLAESAGLVDAKTVVERIGRDIRAATTVPIASTATRLTLWTDADADGEQQPQEVTTWELQSAPGGLGSRLLRTSGVDSARWPTTLTDLTFCYVAKGESACRIAPSPTDATIVVRTTLTYDARTGGGGAVRSEHFSSSLRNVR